MNKLFLPLIGGLATSLTLGGCRQTFTPGQDKGAGSANNTSSERAAFALDSEATEYTIQLLVPKTPFDTPTPLLRWTPYEQAAAYQVAIDDSEDCTSPLSTRRTTDTTLTTDFLANGVYYACVRALNQYDTELARTSGRFWILAHNVADPRRQNGTGGSGASLSTPDLSPFALFQKDWSSKEANLGNGGEPGRLGVASLYSFGIFADPADNDRLKLIANDRGNHRVLVFDSVPTSPTAAPALVVGQTDFTSGRPDAGGTVSALGYSDNVHVSVCPSGQLLVTDRGANRVLVYKDIPQKSGQAADFVIGQDDFTSVAAGTSATRLKEPYAAYCMQGKLLIVDRGNNRILVYDHLPTKNGAAADYVIGQDDLSSGASGCGEARLNKPYEAVLIGDQFAVVDGGNHRVLLFDNMPTRSGAPAAAVLGQTSLDSCAPNRGQHVGADTLLWPDAVASSAGTLAVADAGNHRVVFFKAPFATGMDAAAVLGQTDLVSAAPGAAPALGNVQTPKGLVFDQNYIWVGDVATRRLAVMPAPVR